MKSSSRCCCYYCGVQWTHGAHTQKGLLFLHFYGQLNNYIWYLQPVDWAAKYELCSVPDRERERGGGGSGGGRHTVRCKDDATGGWTEETAKKAASKRIALKACKVREESGE